MKLQINTDRKTIKLDDNTNIGKLIEILEKMLGEDYKKYNIINDIYTYYPWVNPIIIPYYSPTTPAIPYTYPTIPCNTGTYNVELQSIT